MFTSYISILSRLSFKVAVCKRLACSAHVRVEFLSFPFKVLVMCSYEKSYCSIVRVYVIQASKKQKTPTQQNKVCKRLIGVVSMSVSPIQFKQLYTGDICFLLNDFLQLNLNSRWSCFREYVL